MRVLALLCVTSIALVATASVASAAVGIITFVPGADSYRGTTPVGPRGYGVPTTTEGQGGRSATAVQPQGHGSATAAEPLRDASPSPVESPDPASPPSDGPNCEDPDVDCSGVSRVWLYFGGAAMLALAGLGIRRSLQRAGRPPGEAGVRP